MKTIIFIACSGLTVLSSKNLQYELHKNFSITYETLSNNNIDIRRDNPKGNNTLVKRPKPLSTQIDAKPTARSGKVNLNIITSVITNRKLVPHLINVFLVLLYKGKINSQAINIKTKEIKHKNLKVPSSKFIISI